MLNKNKFIWDFWLLNCYLKLFEKRTTILGGLFDTQTPSYNTGNFSIAFQISLLNVYGFEAALRCEKFTEKVIFEIR